MALLKKEDLGNLYLGKHVTAKGWMAKNVRGNSMPKGLYLYVVLIEDRKFPELFFKQRGKIVLE